MATGQVLFTRDTDDARSEIWDDTALIQAYDEAINSMKVHISDRMGSGGVEQHKAPRSHSSDKKRHKKGRKHKKKSNKGGICVSSTPSSPPPMPCVHAGRSQWAVGDRCRAVYTQDGQIYEAVITSINSQNQQCRVRYLGYGNEEDHRLNELITPPTTQTPVPHPAPHPPQVVSAMPFPPFPGLDASGDKDGLPRIPNNLDSPSDKDALHSMLISWYMGGYHTGYYQGLKQGRKQAEMKSASQGTHSSGLPGKDSSVPTSSQAPTPLSKQKPH